MRWLAVLLLAGCATSPQIVYLTPPPALLEPRPLPPFAAETWGDLAQWCSAVVEVAQSCEADRAAIRQATEVPDD